MLRAHLHDCPDAHRDRSIRQTAEVLSQHPEWNQFWIGGRQGANQAFHGVIDEVAVHGATIGHDEMLSLYNRGEGATLVPRGDD